MNVSHNTEVRISENIKVAGARNFIVIPANYKHGTETRAYRFPATVKVTRIKGPANSVQCYSVRSIGKGSAGMTRRFTHDATVLVDGAECSIEQFFLAYYREPLNK